MIKSNELRVGSIIDFDGMKSVVKEIDNQGVVVFIKETDETEWIDLFQFTPISLTEEILLKCGFVKCSYRDNHYNVLGMVIWNCNGMFICNKNGVQLKYLHQLQNLHYCLVGKELEINL